MRHTFDPARGSESVQPDDGHQAHIREGIPPQCARAHRRFARAVLRGGHADDFADKMGALVACLLAEKAEAKVAAHGGVNRSCRAEGPGTDARVEGICYSKLNSRGKHSLYITFIFEHYL